MFYCVHFFFLVVFIKNPLNYNIVYTVSFEIESSQFKSVIKTMFSFPLGIAVTLAFWLDLHRHKDHIFKPIKSESED